MQLSRLPTANVSQPEQQSAKTRQNINSCSSSVVVVVAGVFAPSTRELLFMYFYVKTVPERPSCIHIVVHKMLNPSVGEELRWNNVHPIGFYFRMPFGPARAALRTQNLPPWARISECIRSGLDSVRIHPASRSVPLGAWWSKTNRLPSKINSSRLRLRVLASVIYLQFKLHPNRMLSILCPHCWVGFSGTGKGGPAEEGCAVLCINTTGK